MGLNLPIPTLDPGPDYAAALNAALAFVDQHTHNVGSGVQITPSGLNINTSLPLNTNALLGASFLNFNSSTEPNADTSIYSPDGIDIWFLDGNGNNFAITTGGGVNASVGTLTGGTAQAAFVSNVLVVNSVQSTGVPGNIQAQSVLFGNAFTGTDFVTLSAPSTTSTYGLVLPRLPSAQSFVAIDTSGNLSGYAAVSEGINTANLADTSVTQAKLADNSVTPAKLSAFNSAFTGPLTTSFNNTSPAMSGSVNITTSGRPVSVSLQSDGSGSSSYIGVDSPSSGGAVTATYILKRDGTEIYRGRILIDNDGSLQMSSYIPASSVACIDTGATAGTHTYALFFLVNTNLASGWIEHANLFVYEM